MHDLADRMRAATADPPPTSIDLGRLIAGEQHRSRQLCWAAASSGVAAAVAATVFAVTVLPGWRAGMGGESAPPSASAVELCAPLTPSPTGPMPPEQSYGTIRGRPTEPVADAVARLTAALNDTLLTQLPDVRVAAVGLPGCERPQFQYHPSYKEYFAGAILADSEGSGGLYLALRPTGTENQRDCQPVPDESSCELQEVPGGGTARVETFPIDGGRQYQVDVERPDGTTAHLVANNLHYDSPETRPRVTRPEPVLTVDQMITLGSTPNLTLYP